MASFSALIALLVITGCAAAASAATFTVGDGQGWATGVDYTTWASGKNFSAGDKLVFNYPNLAHTVTGVTKSDYDTCTTSSNVLSNDNSGTTTVTLAAGTNYYICTVGSHCPGGMKLAVTAAGSSSGTPPTSPSTNTSPTGASARLQAGPAVAAAAAALVKLALF